MAQDGHTVLLYIDKYYYYHLLLCLIRSPILLLGLADDDVIRLIQGKCE